MDKTQKLTGNFVLLTADDTKILLPQEQLGQVTYISANTIWNRCEDNSCLFMTDDFDHKNFVALSSNLKPLTDSCKDRLIVLPFTTIGNKDLLWCWNTAQALNDVSFELVSLPKFTTHKQSPIRDYIIYKDEIVFPCDTQHLANYALSEVSYE